MYNFYSILSFEAHSNHLCNEIFLENGTTHLSYLFKNSFKWTQSMPS